MGDNDECSTADAVDTWENDVNRAPDVKEKKDNTIALSSSSSKEEINKASTLSVEEETLQDIAASTQ